MLWLFAIGLPVALFLMFGQPEKQASRLLGPPQDGSWELASVDGNPAGHRYTLDIRFGKIAGGYDGCNAWGFTDGRDANGDRMIMQDARACDEGPHDSAYRALRSTGLDPLQVEGDRMIVNAAGQRMEFRRSAP